jgi:amidase
MIFSEYSKYDGLGLAELVRRGEVSPNDLIDSAIDAIERLNPKINCVVQQLPQHGRARSNAACPTGRSVACRSWSRSSACTSRAW